MTKIAGFGRVDDDCDVECIFALYSPIMAGCGTSPKAESATSPSGAKGAARTSPLQYRPCLTPAWIVGECPLCGTRRRYLPNDIFRGKLSHKVIGKSSRLGAQLWER